jgi:hypothetical protein
MCVQVRWLPTFEDFSIVLDCGLESDERTADTELTYTQYAAEDMMASKG